MKSELRYEDAARKVLITDEAGNVIDTGWQSLPRANPSTMQYLGIFTTGQHGDSAEHQARSMNATDFPCRCGDRHTGRGYNACDKCRNEAANTTWLKEYAEKAIDWDGKSPLSVNDGDKFLWDADEVRDYVLDFIAGGGELADVRLTTTKPDHGQHFEMTEFLQDSLHEDSDLDDREINKAVNDWITANAPFSYWATGIPVKVESLGIESADIAEAIFGA